MRKNQFKRPEPGFSLYEGRTRGKRIKYTYSDDEDDFYSDSTNRRSTRHTRNHTPAELLGPTTTMSGRQIRAPRGMNVENAESASGGMHGDQFDDSGVHQEERLIDATGRPRRSAAAHHGTNGWQGRSTRSSGYNSMDNMDEDENGSEPEFGDDEEDVDEHVPDESEDDEDEFDEDEAMADDDLDDSAPKSLVVKLSVSPDAICKVMKPAANGNGSVSHSNAQNEEEISVAVLPKSPASTNGVPVVKATTPEPSLTAAADVKQTMTPSSGTPSTSLAFRGSPEKPQCLPRPVDIGVQH
jgi:hypothetical protein